jgi:hypothetical protein
MTRYKIICPYSVVYAWATSLAHARKMYPDHIDIEEV